MYSLFLDTNILLDEFVPSRPRHADVLSLFARTCDKADVELLVLASSLKDMYYTFVKHYGSEPKCRELISLIRRICGVVSLTDDLVALAIASDEPDFEDGLVRVAAEYVGAEFIVTHDKKAFLGSSVSKASAKETLEWMDSLEADSQQASKSLQEQTE